MCLVIKPHKAQKHTKARQAGEATKSSKTTFLCRPNTHEKDLENCISTDRHLPEAISVQFIAPQGTLQSRETQI